jgi:hypothetical protein
MGLLLARKEQRRLHVAQQALRGSPSTPSRRGAAPYLTSLSPMSSAPVHLPAAALLTIKQSVEPFVMSARKGGDGWTAAQFAHAALLLLDSEHNAVTLGDMEMQLGRHNSTALGINPDAQAAAGGQAVAALVRANQLSLRPYSDWARDVPEEAYGSLSSTIVTAASAVHLSCMRDMRGKLQISFQQWDQQQLSPQVRKQLLDQRQFVAVYL